jgi:hypothetical protein
MLDILECFLCYCDWNICYIIYLDCVGILLHICLFWEVHFSAIIMSKFWGLIETNFIGVIFFFGKMVEFSFVESCFLAGHNIEFARGQRKAVLLLELE